MYNCQVLKKSNLYYSTNLKSPQVSFRVALLKGIAPDGGLYMPVGLPLLSSNEIYSLSNIKYPDLAAEILYKIIGDEITKEDLSRICRDIYTFDIPIEYIDKKSWMMRLDQGPTASFKDFAALMMGKLMEHFLSVENHQITILTATSGDTGSAVANAFNGLKNIRAIILFPRYEISDIQRRQMTTLNDNIHVVAVNGKFDDCQKLVKMAFLDPSLSGFNLSSANSINIGRLLPQSVYYFWAYSQLSKDTEEKLIFSVPSGNFGNLTGGLFAKKMGLPVKRFIISTNENDEVPVFFRTGIYKPVSPSRNCISSAMNVGHPSNLARIISIYGGQMDETGEILKYPDMQSMKNDFHAVSLSEEQTRETIKYFYRDFGKVIEPHGAVAWAGLQDYVNKSIDSTDKNHICISLETAHPAKFSEEIRKILNIETELPDSLTRVKAGKEEYISLENNYNDLKKLIIGFEQN